VAVALGFDDVFLTHDPGLGHPESVERARAVQAWLPSVPDVVRVPARAATRTELLRVHTAAYLDRLTSLRGRSARLDPDTATSEGSIDAAEAASGLLIDLASGVVDGRLPPGLALVRPPGHHATADRSMGFCLLNHVAVAARALQASGQAERVAIFDWDVHHGNGTEAIFWRDPTVLYLSVHQSPLYPGTGAASDVGEGPGVGTTLNVPLPAGSDDVDLLEASRRLLEPAVVDFAPDVILISAGFDGLAEDPLAGLMYTASGFRELAARWRDVAERTCQGRIAGVLEGGYDLDGLVTSIQATLDAWRR
jgi:acetoin utilization deacetylase AcuC-like enzyme